MLNNAFFAVQALAVTIGIFGTINIVFIGVAVLLVIGGVWYVVIIIVSCTLAPVNI